MHTGYGKLLEMYKAAVSNHQLLQSRTTSNLDTTATLFGLEAVCINPNFREIRILVLQSKERHALSTMRTHSD